MKSSSRKDIFDKLMNSNYSLDEICKIVNCSARSLIQVLWTEYPITNSQDLEELRNRLRDRL